MALIQCPKCGTYVSSNATQCPHCEAELYPLYFTICCRECFNTIRFNEWTCPYCGNKRSKILSYIEQLFKGCFSLILSAYLLFLAVAIIGAVILILYILYIIYI